MKKTISALLFSAFMLYLPCLIERANGSFRLAKIASDMPFTSSWQTDPPSEELRGLLSKPFFYLGRGAQAFVFESEDHRYVIKLFRNSAKIHPWRQFIRKTFLKRKERRTPEEKRQLLFGACKTAFTKAPDLTGLVYIHLNPTKELSATYLFNRIGRKIPIDLNQYCFAIQKKGISVYETLQKAKDSQDLEKYKKLVQSMVLLIEERASRNICNLDKKMGENFGFLGDRAIEWDFGNYAINENLSKQELQEAEIEIFTRSFQDFLNQNFPHWPLSINDYRSAVTQDPSFDRADLPTQDVLNSSNAGSVLH